MERGKKGIGDCLMAATSLDNVPTYAGIGTGLIAGNYLAKKMDEWYSSTLDSATPETSAETFVRYVARSAGRLVTSSALCAVSGGMGKGTKDFLQSAAIGSTGMIAVDLLKTYGGESIAPYADLGKAHMGRRVAAQNRVRSLQRASVTNMPPTVQTRPVANRSISLQNRRQAVMEAGGLGGMNGRETNSLSPTCERKANEVPVSMRL